MLQQLETLALLENIHAKLGMLQQLETLALLENIFA